ncbi:MAG: cytochrome c oxidase subunit II, partial [Actinomycetota bacterium]|nr:cytochrome c oxidase subunit II [Actinomycetota bacterium]
MATVGNTRDHYYEVFNVFTPIMLGVGVLFSAAILFAVFRFRSKEGGISRAKTESPGKESLYALSLACLTAYLVYLTFSTMDEEVDPGPSPDPAPGPALDIDVTAARWNWRFDYPRFGITQVDHAGQPAELVVPVNTNVYFEARTADVIHSFFVPALRFKADAFPGQVNRFRLAWPTTGFFGGKNGQCAQYCGLRHTDMRFH